MPGLDDNYWLKEIAIVINGNKSLDGTQQPVRDLPSSLAHPLCCLESSIKDQHLQPVALPMNNGSLSRAVRTSEHAPRGPSGPAKEAQGTYMNSMKLVIMVHFIS